MLPRYLGLLRLPEGYVSPGGHLLMCQKGLSPLTFICQVGVVVSTSEFLPEKTNGQKTFAANSEDLGFESLWLY